MKAENRRRIEDQLRTIRAIADCDAGVHSCCNIIAETLDDELEDLSDEFGANALDDGDLVVDGPAPEKPEDEPEHTVSPFLHQVPSEQSDTSDTSEESAPSDRITEEIKCWSRDFASSPAKHLLEQLRTACKVTVKDLAAYFGISTRMVNKILAGANSPRVSAKVAELCEEA